MPPSLRLCVCLILLATCSARPSWHKGIEKNENPKPEVVEEVIEKIHEQNANVNHRGETRLARQAPNPFHFNGRHPGGIPNFNNPQLPFPGQQNFGQPFGRQPPGLHPIGQLQSTIQNIIGSHLEATVQQNKAMHEAALNNGFPRPPGLRPLLPPVCPSCGGYHHTHSYHETSHHIHIGRPQIIPTGTHVHQFDGNCPEGVIGCRENPVRPNPNPWEPSPGKEIPENRPTTTRTTTTEQQEFEEFDDGKDSDIIFGDDKDPKNLDSNNPDIDIRFGGGDSGDVLPSKN